MLRADDHSIIAKHESSGVTCVKTHQAIIVAHYDAPILPSECTIVAEKLGDYLRSVQY